MHHATQNAQQMLSGDADRCASAGLDSHDSNPASGEVYAEETLAILTAVSAE